MIKKIEYIRDFGSFKDYKWKNCEEFNKINLIFGWNYSGKTTLSRIFRSFEENDNHHADSGARFKLIADKDEKFTDKDLHIIRNVRVFNRDYIKQNLKWDDSEAESFAILGKENVSLAKEIADLKSEKEHEEGGLNDLKKNKDMAEKTLFENLSDRARDIKNDFSLPGYNKTVFEEDIKKLSEDAHTYVLPDKEFAETRKAYNTSERKDSLDPLELSFKDLNSEYVEIIELCQRKITGKKIEELEEDGDLSEWVRDGLSLHIESDRCRFCGSVLADQLERYHRHFSKEYEHLLEKLNYKKGELENYKVDIGPHKKEQFYPIHQEMFESVKHETKIYVNEYNESIGKLIEMINKKISNIFNSIECEPFLFVANNDCLRKYDELISRNNGLTDKFEEERKSALEKLIQHRVASFVKEYGYYEKKSEIETLSLEIEYAVKWIETLDSKIEEAEQKMYSADGAAEYVNEIFTRYYGKNEISLTNNGRMFSIERQGNRAKDLSEGEQTAIAFSYFIASLKGSDISKMIVFIDDPISSLDSNHLFFTYSIIKNEFILPKGEGAKCDQLFISTHNYEFFNHFRKHQDRKNQKKKMNLYMIKRNNNSASRESALTDLPPVLKNYDSEYLYLCNRVFDFRDNPDDVEFDQLYDLPNILRKILEMYMSFKYQDSSDDTKIEIFGDQMEVDRVYKFINHESHSRTSGLMQQSDLSECKAVVEIVLSKIKEDDVVHFESIEAKIKKPMMYKNL